MISGWRQLSPLWPGSMTTVAPRRLFKEASSSSEIADDNAPDGTAPGASGTMAAEAVASPAAGAADAGGAAAGLEEGAGARAVAPAPPVGVAAPVDPDPEAVHAVSRRPAVT